MELYTWQKQAIEMADGKSEFALLADPGTGKTRTMIEILRKMFNSHKQVMTTLIISPSVTLYNWRNEITRYSAIKQDAIEILSGNIAKRSKTIVDSKSKIFITNYEAFVNKDFLKACMTRGIEVMILDESHYCKNPTSKRSKAIYQLANYAKCRFIMTGTLVTNSVEDVFMQYKILDMGKSFGTDLKTFRSKYMFDANEAWKSSRNYFPKWQPRREKFDEIQNIIYNKAIRVTMAECTELPPLIEKTMPVELSVSQKRYYNQMMRDFVAVITEGAKTGVITAELAVTKGIRLQQIVSGFVQDEEGNVIEIKDNPRLDALKELLEALHVKHKVIVWCSFTHNYDQISKVCDKLGIKYVKIVGGMSSLEKDTAINNFETDEQYRICIANRRAGGIGVNLVAASYSIVYSRNFSLEEEIQSKARNYRGGSQIHKTVVKIDLCATDTLDEHITAALKDKKNIADSIVEYVKR